MKDQWYVCVKNDRLPRMKVGQVVTLCDVQESDTLIAGMFCKVAHVRLYGAGEKDNREIPNGMFIDQFVPCCRYPLPGEYWTNVSDHSNHKIETVSDCGKFITMRSVTPGAIHCTYSVNDVVANYTYNPGYVHIGDNVMTITDGAGQLRVAIGKLNDSKYVTAPSETPEGQSFANFRYYLGRIYQNISSGKQYVVKEMIPERNCARMQVVNSTVECMVSYNHLLRYYTPVEVPRLAEDDKTQTYIREILKRLEGTDTLRPGIEETPERVAKAFDHWFGGYHVNIAELFKTFEDGAEDCDEMVVSRRIPFFSHCEHHMAQIAGFVDIAYIPNGCIVGLSKLNRLVDAYARRLQVQERLTNQIANTIEQYLKPLGVAVRVVATHACIESRGVCDCGGDTVTMAVRGVFKTEPETRHEFLAHCSK